ALDLGDVWLRDVERWHLRGRQQQELVALHELAHAMVERRPLDLGVGQLTRGELEALLGIPDHRVLDLVTMLGQHRTVARREREGPQRTGRVKRDASPLRWRGARRPGLRAPASARH